MKSELLSIIIIGTLGCASTSPSQPPPSNATPTAAKAPVRSYESLVKIGRTYCDSGKAAKALKPLKQAIAQAPQRPEAYVVLGYSFAAQKKLNESTAAYEKARILGSKERRLFQELSSVYDVQEKYAAAIGIYRAWLKISPTDSEMRHDLSLSLLLAGQIPEAIELLQKVIAESDKPSQAQADLAYAYARSGQHAKAIVLLHKLYPKGLPYGLLIEFIQTYESPKQALDFFNRFAVKPLDKNHHKIRSHLLGLIQK